jgi:diguanylate cyclase (GGDEF)-like protein
MSSSRRPVWPVLLPCAAFALGAAFVVSTVLAGNPDLGGAGFLVIDVCGLGLSIRAARRGADRTARRPWRWVSACWVLTIVTGMALAIASTERVPAALVWLGLGCRFVQSPVMMVGVLLDPVHPLTRRVRVRLALDAATLIGGGFMVLWFFLLGPALRRAGGMSADSLVSLVFLFEDLAAVITIYAVLVRARTSRLDHPLTPLVGGIILLVGIDVYTSWKAVYQGTLLTTQAEVLPFYLVLMAALSLIGLAAGLENRLGAVAAPADAPPGRVGVAKLPYLALAVGYGLLAVAARNSPFPWAGLVGGAITMTGAVAVRQWLALRENHRLAVSDPLTGLANRALLREELDRAIDCPGTAILLFDLDDFKSVNDAYGHDIGDRVLIEFARVVQRQVRASDLVARLGGDEFAAVLTGIDNDAAAVEVAERIIDAALGIVVGEAVRGVRTSVGIALNRPGLTPSQLVRRADVAMYGAKRDRTSGWAVYTEPTTAEPGPGPDRAARPEPLAVSVPGQG